MKPDLMLPPDSPLIQPFLATLPPDDRLKTAEGDVRQAAAAIASLRGRARELLERSSQIAADFAGATGPKRKDLLAQRISLQVEQAMTHAVAEETGQQYVTALITWARAVRRTAVTAHDDAFEQMTPLASASRSAATIRDRHGIHAESESVQNPASAAAATADLDAIARELRPLQQRVRLARDAISGIDFAIGQLFGEQSEQLRAAVAIDQSRRDQFVRSVVRTIERSAA